MLDEATRARAKTWNEDKLAQWARVKDRVAGLQLARSGEQLTEFTLTISTDDFYESVIFGRLPQVVRVPAHKGRPPTRGNEFRLAEEYEKPLGRQAVDLTDADLAAVIGRWKVGQTALVLDPIASVWRSDGKEYVKP